MLLMEINESTSFLKYFWTDITVLSVDGKKPDLDMILLTQKIFKN